MLSAPNGASLRSLRCAASTFRATSSTCHDAIAGSEHRLPFESERPQHNVNCAWNSEEGDQCRPAASPM
eukprot:6173348-Pleurochrysis_carterae.AAC.3